MSFLSPLFLLVLPLAAVPVVIHLLNRRRQEVIRWGAMQFLFEGQTRRRRNWRWEDLILMLLRTAAVLALIFALAQPLIRSHWLGGATGRDVVLVLDDSMSTARAAGDGLVFDSVIQQANALVEDLNDGDTVRVLLSSGGPEWLTPSPVPADAESRRLLRERIAQLLPTLDSANLLTCVQDAINAKAPPSAVSRYIVVLTDGCANGWQSDASSAWQGVQRSIEAAQPPIAINVVDASSTEGSIVTNESSNFSVDQISTNRSLLGVGEPFTVTARIRNTGTSETASAAIQWKMDGSPLGMTAVPVLEPGQSASVPLEHSIATVGVFQIQCRVDLKDPLSIDNASSLVIEVVDRVPIAVVEPQPEFDLRRSDASYLLAALGHDRASEEQDHWQSVFAPTVVDWEEVDSLELDDFRCIVLLDTNTLSDEFVIRLTEFVHQGGGLWICTGPRTRLKSFNRTWYNSGDGLCPLPIADAVGNEDDADSFQTIHPPTSEHPATSMLGDTQRLDIDKVKIHRRHPFVRFAQSTSGLPILLETGQGKPIAIEKYTGRGRVIAQGVPLGLRWTNLPLCHTYVALTHEWLWYLTQPTATPRNLHVGEAIVIRQTATSSDAPATMASPAGDQVTLIPTQENGQHVYRYAQTHRPGDYLLTVKAEDEDLRIPFRVMRDARESNLHPLSEEQRKLIADTGAVRFVTDPLSSPADHVAEVRREPVWSMMLIALLLLMVAELFMMSRSARRRFEPSPVSVLNPE